MVSRGLIVECKILKGGFIGFPCNFFFDYNKTQDAVYPRDYEWTKLVKT